MSLVFDAAAYCRALNGPRMLWTTKDDAPANSFSSSSYSFVAHFFSRGVFSNVRGWHESRCFSNDWYTIRSMRLDCLFIWLGKRLEGSCVPSIEESLIGRAGEEDIEWKRKSRNHHNKIDNQWPVGFFFCLLLWTPWLEIKGLLGPPLSRLYGEFVLRGPATGEQSARWRPTTLIASG